ncbi:acyltransferase [Gordonia malaquae]|uniref:acyltransferase n=1 Tax=Gordonia malaquae TaxID=410332 RepID=UPI0030FE9B1E
MEQAVIDRQPVGSRAGRPSRALTADFVRVLLFTGVVVAHSVNGINNGPDTLRAAGLVGVLLHLTRYGFVAVTLFVLVLSMQGKTMTPIQFWRRRFGLVVWPYLAWTLIYTVTDHLLGTDNPFPGVGQFADDLGRSVITGEAKYQLYFLLISMQIYLFFPLIAAVMDRTAHRPWLVLGVGAVIQGTMFVIYQYLPRPSGPVWDVVYQNLWKTLPMYALFIAIGAVAAYHRAPLEAWLREHAVGVVLAAVVGASFSIGWFLATSGPGRLPDGATTPWNPVFLPWLVSGLVLLWMGAMWWDGMRQSGRRVGARAVSAATLRAFGVFAVHPLILDVLARAGYFDALFTWFPNSATIRSVLLVVATLALSLVLVDLLLRTPVSKWVVARDRIPLPRLRRRRSVSHA